MLSWLPSGFAKITKADVRVFEISKPNTAAYAKASFDARVIIRLDVGRKLYGLKKEVEGIDGLGLFYKVRLKKGLYAFILDTSVKGFEAKKKSDLSENVETTEEVEVTAEVEEKVEEKEEESEIKSGGISGRASIGDDKPKLAPGADPYAKHSVPYAKSYGMVLSMINYGVKTKSSTRKSTELFFGGKISGAGWVNFVPVPVDLTLLFSPSSPSLFDSFTVAHSGYAALLDASVPLEWKKGPKWSLFGHVGGVLSYYKFDITVGNDKSGASKFELGLSAGGGAGYRFGRYIAKLEAKYMYVGPQHIGINMSLQRIF